MNSIDLNSILTVTSITTKATVNEILKFVKMKITENSDKPDVVKTLHEVEEKVEQIKKEA